MRKLFIILTVLILVITGQASSFAEVIEDRQGRPNIVYINADDYGVMDVGYMSECYNTPNLDRLRSEGMNFTDGYAAAANCAPSRACVMSGQLGPRHGVYTVNNSDRGNAKDRKLIPIKNTLHLQDDNLTIAGSLQKAGYKTIHLGKWHVGADPLKQGFDINIGGNAGGSPTGGYFVPFGKGSMQQYNDDYPKGTHRVDIFTDHAIRFMRENKENPFFVHMAYYSVHTGLEAVPEFVDNYKGKENVHAVYASMVEKMDQGIGKIIDELDALELKEKTLIVFSSDNGGVTSFADQDPYRSGKGSYFEGGIRVPLLVSWKGRIEPNSTSEVPVSGIDFYPTFLEVAGLPVPEGKVLDGSSLMPLLEQKGSFAERALFWHFPIYLQASHGKNGETHDPLFRTRPGSVIRQGKWKLHEYFEDGRIELYNMEEDLGERSNLASSNPEKAGELHRLLKQWRKQMKAPVPTELNPLYGVSTKEGTKKKKKKK